MDIDTFVPNTQGPDAARLQVRIRSSVREEREILSRTIGDLASHELVQYLEALEHKYGLAHDTQFPGRTFPQFFVGLLQAFQVPLDGDFAGETLREVMKLPIGEVIELFTRMSVEKRLEDSALAMRVTTLMNFLYYANHAIHALHRSMQTSKDAGSLVPMEDRNVVPIVPGLTQFRILEPDELNDYQKLIMHMLAEAKMRGFRKFNGDCYVQRYTDRQEYTHAWERSCSIKDFVYEACNKELVFDVWRFMTQNRSNASAVIDYLSNCKDPEFPDLIKDRHVFSFSNGVYISKHWDGERFRDVFWPYDSDRKLPCNIVSCKYFDLPFDDYANVEDWYDIPTPHLQTIMEFQEWPEDVCRWMYVFIGRLLYEVGEIDCWQVIPFLKGTAGSGKSTIVLKVCANLFDKADVGILSNNIERKFGISAFVDKYLFVAPEIKADLQMEQAEFQSIVSGEDIQVNVKFQKAHSVEWHVPGILAGNELPNWGDNSGSFSRRAIIFEFLKQVKNGDMELARKLDREMAAILKKCNRGYLETATQYARDNVWNHLPAYFRQTRSELEEAANSAEHFLSSGKMVFGKDLHCRYDDFVAAYREHAKAFNFPFKKISKDLWNTPFQKRTMRVVFEERNNMSTYWVRGADFAERQGFQDF
jgi:GTPase SAR1 family protein